MNIPDSYEKALIRAKKICATRENSISDIHHKLHEWGVSESEASKILQTLLVEKFIDEYRYAMAAVQDKFHLNKWGSYKIRQFLRQKGIPDGIIQEALSSIDVEENHDLIEKLLIAKYKTLKGGKTIENRYKLLKFVQSKGFDTHTAMQILEKLFQ